MFSPQGAQAAEEVAQEEEAQEEEEEERGQAVSCLKHTHTTQLF